MFVVIVICTILIALWLSLLMINAALSGIHVTLKEIRDDIAESRGSLANVEILADKRYGHVD